MTPLDADRARALEGRQSSDGMLVDVEGFEGPLDMLLTLARAQKVDLRRISVLRLAEQYLDFVSQARARRIELAADYLVMASWLAYLKSRLLLPAAPADDDPTGEEMAARLAHRLERLDAMRRMAATLMARDQLGQDRFVRGQTEALSLRKRVVWRVGLADLLSAYGRIKARDDYRPLALERPEVYPLEAAIARLRRILGGGREWRDLASGLPGNWLANEPRRRSALASSFVAALELAREGTAEIHQDIRFGPILIRSAVRERA